MAANLSLTHRVTAAKPRWCHRVFLFRIRKDPFNGFFALCINLLRTFRFAYLFNQIQILLPDMCGVYLLPFFIRTAFSSLTSLRSCPE